MTQPRQLMLAGSAVLAIAAFGPAIGAKPTTAGETVSTTAPIYDAILHEGLEHSETSAITAELADDIGPRLTGSPNMARAYAWAMAKAERIGLEHIRLEPVDIDPIRWELTDVSVRLTAPDRAVLVAQAGAWSVPTGGTLSAEALPVTITSEADFAAYRGKLAGRIVLLGPMRPVPPLDRPLTVRYTDEEITAGTPNQAVRAVYQDAEGRRRKTSEAGLFKARLHAFLEEEKVLAVMLPSRDGDRGGGTGNLSVDEGPFSVRSWHAGERPRFPFAYLAIEHFGRLWRLAETGRHPHLELRIATDENPKGTPTYNLVAEIPGSDPKLAAQVVLAGAHLDSWASGTGALDNASGVAAVLEAARILKQVGFHPRRTIRIVLFGAEEQGLYGSYAYVGRHLGSFPRGSSPDQLAIPSQGRRTTTGPLAKLRGYRDFSIMFNMDGGSGKVRGVFAGDNPALAAKFRDWIAPLKPLGVLAVYDEPFYPADQSSFSDIGLPGVMFQQDPLEYFTRARHSNMDTMERISPEDLAQQATVLATFLARSASDDTLMPRPR